MATWAIGDLQGCYDELARLLDKIQYNAANDALWFCGDLVNRGGQSLEVLRLLRTLGDQTVVTLGNHDLSLLAVAERNEAEQARVNPELGAILFAPDREELLGWLRRQSLLHHDEKLNFTMVHAGFAPRWTLAQAQRAAREVERQLRGPDHARLMRSMFGNKPAVWSGRLKGIERMRASINVLTRLRYCDVRGRIAFGEKGAPGTQQPGLYPWYEVPGMVKRETRIVCGHWSALGRFSGLGIYAIDTGCVWGGSLTALRLDAEEPYFVSIKSTRPPPAARDMD
ncbi:symmetrical bis(5'-nucleosyl)-tetraphosphatase [Tahibacter amnicola]|uniref:bis(5'-nucleosyl)-tetraphosphatase (symmetrical) n=1 Tax=Tahibacter amnicola TaxID=2976241 RepID=A0ABY6BEB0_9GAMM|nr:symmetrical bis(5'-nucleosyl)-tetraphosphatase [Tahibacter amnicola]UXI67445.1 symmetrical bis(5'-nucleosyl)-tetraphosphatase [Tahibacter amnicola]